MTVCSHLVINQGRKRLETPVAPTVKGRKPGNGAAIRDSLDKALTTSTGGPQRPIHASQHSNAATQTKQTREADLGYADARPIQDTGYYYHRARRRARCREIQPIQRSPFASKRWRLKVIEASHCPLDFGT